MRRTIAAVAVVMVVALTVGVSAQRRKLRGNPGSTAGTCSDVNCTAPGTLTLTPTFDNIGVKLTYTNDNNTNNAGSLQYRVHGTSTWLDAHTASFSTVANWPDRRSTVSGGTSNSANQKQFRASIVGLTQGEQYDVQLTVSDADGLNGAAVQSGTTTMLSTSTLVVQSGTTKYLDTNAAGGGDGSIGTPYNTWANAQTGTACGDTLIIKANSTVTGVTMSKSCSASTWYVVSCENNTNVIFAEGASTTPNLTVSGDFAKIYSCRFGTSSDGNITLSSTPTNIWLDSNYFVDSGTAAASGECGADGGAAATRYGESAIEIGGGAHDIYITNNTILSPYLKANAECGTQAWDSPFFGIGSPSAASSTGLIIIKGNTMDGGWRDCIGGSPETTASHYDNSDVLNNTITGCKDDQLQLEASDINLRIGGNTITTGSVGWACIAMQTGFFGPIYVYRNYCTFSSVHAGTAYKIGNTEAAYWFHNSLNVTTAGADAWSDSNGGTSQIYTTALNNITKIGSGNPLYRIYPTGTTFNYNQYYKTSGTTIASSWNGSSNYTLAQFCSNASQECQGQSGDPLFDGSLHIDSSSPAYNHGVAIANFNDATSAWPATHGAVDMGAYEVP